MVGEVLCSKLIDETSLPKDFAEKEFFDLLQQYGLSQNTLTLDDLREVLADYVQDLFLEMKNPHSSNIEA